MLQIIIICILVESTKLLGDYNMYILDIAPTVLPPSPVSLSEQLLFTKNSPTNSLCYTWFGLQPQSSSAYNPFLLSNSPPPLCSSLPDLAFDLAPPILQPSQITPLIKCNSFLLLPQNLLKN